MKVQKFQAVIEIKTHEAQPYPVRHRKINRCSKCVACVCAYAYTYDIFVRIYGSKGCKMIGNEWPREAKGAERKRITTATKFTGEYFYLFRISKANKGSTHWHCADNVTAKHRENGALPWNKQRIYPVLLTYNVWRCVRVRLPECESGNANEVYICSNYWLTKKNNHSNYQIINK